MASIVLVQSARTEGRMSYEREPLMGDDVSICRATAKSLRPVGRRSDRDRRTPTSELRRAASASRNCQHHRAATHGAMFVQCTHALSLVSINFNYIFGTHTILARVYARDSAYGAAVKHVQVPGTREGGINHKRSPRMECAYLLDA